MPSTFLGLNTGLSGLNHFQTSLNTTSHNISNADTEGYSRQAVQGSAANPLDISARYGMMGTGVQSTGVDRVRNVYYDEKYWASNTKYNKYNTQNDNLMQMQLYMNEISGDSGYTKWISKMSDALQDLADNPADNTTRISYTLTADSFTDMVNEMSANFQDTQKSINDEIELAVSEINSLSKQIYDLTQQIISIELKGSNANDLRDQRTNCIDKLSEYVEVDVVEESIMYGVGDKAVPSHAKSLTVRIDNNILVDMMTFNELMVAPRNARVNQNDAEGLVDVFWANADGTPGEKFVSDKTGGKLEGLFNIRDGNNAEAFAGTTTEISEDPSYIKVKTAAPINVNKLNIPSQGSITLNGRVYMYDGWEAEYDENGDMSEFTFSNLTMYNEKHIEENAKFPAGIVGYPAIMGANNPTRGIPYYQAKLNELVRTISSYMNQWTTAGVDANGDPGLDMFTAEEVPGTDFVLKDTMVGSGTIKSSDASYYRLTSLNWELSGAWKTDPSKVVVSYKEDIEQGNIDYRPIVDKILKGMTDVNMFEQGTVSQFLQSVTTNMAVDISKMKVFADNQDDIRYTIDNQRKSFSGVDQNEEAADLVKFENLYNLSSKVIQVLNEVYDRLITQTGV